MISHNVTLGQNCMIAPKSAIGGSTTVGNTCWIGLNSTLKDRLRIGNHVIVASSAGVTHDFPDYDIVAGVPARSIRHKVNSDMLFMMAGQKRNEEEVFDIK